MKNIDTKKKHTMGKKQNQQSNSNETINGNYEKHTLGKNIKNRTQETQKKNSKTVPKKLKKTRKPYPRN